MNGYIVKEHSNLDFAKMTPEELAIFIQTEKKRCAHMNDWDEAWTEIAERK